MLVEADRTGCLREVLVITAALSIQDPRERPAEQRQAADASTHAPASIEDGSDFLAFLKLWEYVQEQRDALTGNRFRKLLREEFLHFLRIREWQDLHGQLRRAARNAGMTLNDVPADPDRDPRRGALRPAQPGRPARGRDARVPRRPRAPSS